MIMLNTIKSYVISLFLQNQCSKIITKLGLHFVKTDVLHLFWIFRHSFFHLDMKYFPNQKVEEPKNDKKDQDSEDKEVSFKEGLFNFSRAEDVKKKPIYMRNFSPDKKLKIKPDVFDDLYDMGNIPSDSSQDDKNAKKKKKKRAPAKRKQKAGMILAFDSNKTQVANVVKKMMNVQSAKKVKAQPRRNLNLKGAETKKIAVPEKNSPKMLHEAVEISQPDIILNPVPSTSKQLQVRM